MPRRQSPIGLVRGRSRRQSRAPRDASLPRWHVSITRSTSCAAGWWRIKRKEKRSLLGVAAGNVVSAAAAAQMAAGVARLMGADVAVATTGVAGDDPHDGVAGGTVFIATLVAGEADVIEHHFEGAPEMVCEQATVQALRDLLDRLPEGGGG